MIRINELKFFYGEKPAIDIEQVSFDNGIAHGIAGLNGAGKTTLFNLLAAYHKPASGSILMNNTPLKRQDVCFLETENFFYSNITGREYLKIFPASNSNFNLDEINKLFQLPLDFLIESYSTGMKKKLAILSVVQQDKPVYVFDEPFNGLDLESNQILKLIISKLLEKGKTIFISSHILQPLTESCQMIHILQEGKITRSFPKNEFGNIENILFGDFNMQTEKIISKYV